MAYLPLDLTTRTIASNTEIQGNFTALDNAISGNLTQANFSSGTQIPSSLLATPNIEETLSLQYTWTAALTAGVRVTTYVPSGTYTIRNVHVTFNAAGGTAATGNSWSLSTGSYNGTGTYTVGATIVNSSAFYASASNISGDANVSPLVSSIAGPQTIALSFAVSGTPPTSGFLCVTLTVTRSLQ